MPEKTPAHTLVRVRNNQRRHRQRRREYVAYLEQKLEETEISLSQAVADVAVLKIALAERALNDSTWTLQNASYPVMPHLVGRQPNQLEQEQEQEFMVEEAGETSITAQHSISASDTALATSAITQDMSRPISTTIDFNITDTPALSILPSPRPPFNPSVIHTEHSFDYFPVALPTVDEVPISTFAAPSPTASQGHKVLSLACDNYPASGIESTTLCSQAYSLIAQQNYRGLNANVIRSWLDQGFRRARSQDEGCRVDNRLLFALLDFINGA